MSKKGVIFDIKQFAVFDGPGIRTTVFMKGCPLRCMWCHNPEGLSFKPELMVSRNGCVGCGKCADVCGNPDGCALCGKCVRACPNGLRRICGEIITAEALSKRLLRDQDYLRAQNGGVTFSGGEPLAQPEFLMEALDRLSSLHRAIETSGYSDKEVFRQVIDRTDYIIMDIKMIDEEKHLYYTGVSNKKILSNLNILKDSGKPFRIRIPMIPGVNDSDENLEETARLLLDAPALDMVELMPYHVTAGAKYEMVNRKYKPEFDVDAKPNMNISVFSRYNIICKTL